MRSIVGKRSRGGVGGLDIAVADMLVGGFVEVEGLEFPAVEPDAGGLIFGTDRHDLRPPAILAEYGAVVAGELDAVALHNLDAA
jgi:hypothetical protein